METIQVTKNAYPINDAMNVLFSKLDEAIDDMEAGRVISEEELWAEIDAIQVGALGRKYNYKRKEQESERIVLRMPTLLQ